MNYQNHPGISSTFMQGCGKKTSQDVYHGMVIEDTSALERLLVVDQEGPTRINVISAPKLTVVGYSSDKYSELVIGSTPVHVQQPASTSKTTTTTKHLVPNKLG